ncbi:DNA mismatch repair protein MutH-like protein [Dinothrombium tinctorium]|uniref:DNA-directed DNA polymerase n=1 Tax=Dinothrombium tinctorium TaxID=1965070 RepID=A0A443QDJ5_9ACAR|nr:DNA mismatch repair protein MutH-like protein [Dinothrombium tinctorium]
MSRIGGLVFLKKEGVYKKVTSLDFNHMYPSIMSTFNISYSTSFSVTIENYEKNKNRFDSETNATESSLSGFKCISFKKPVSALSKGLKYLIRIRESENSSQFLKRFLKLLSNACYGIHNYRILNENSMKTYSNKLSNELNSCINIKLIESNLSTFSRDNEVKTKNFFFNNAAADATVMMGRAILQEAINFFESSKYDVFYGDTDGIFISNLNIENIDLKTIQSHLREKFHFDDEKNFSLKIENTYPMLAIFAKKRYIGLTENDQVIVKGLTKMMSENFRQFFLKLLKLISFDSIFKSREEIQLEICNEFERISEKNKKFHNLCTYINLDRYNDSRTILLSDCLKYFKRLPHQKNRNLSKFVKVSSYIKIKNYSDIFAYCHEEEFDESKHQLCKDYIFSSDSRAVLLQDALNAIDDNSYMTDLLNFLSDEFYRNFRLESSNQNETLESAVFDLTLENAEIDAFVLMQTFLDSRINTEIKEYITKLKYFIQKTSQKHLNYEGKIEMQRNAIEIRLIYEEDEGNLYVSPPIKTKHFNYIIIHSNDCLFDFLTLLFVVNFEVYENSEKKKEITKIINYLKENKEKKLIIKSNLGVFTYMNTNECLLSIY